MHILFFFFFGRESTPPLELRLGEELDVKDFASFGAVSANSLDLDFLAVLDADDIVFPHSDEVYHL